MNIKQDVIEVLEQCKIEDNKLFLPDGQLDRKLYLDVDKVLKLAGGKWNRSAKAHLFTDDIGDLLDTLILSGEIADIKKELQYFATPPAVVKQLIELADLQPDDSVLEPSAGEGAIALEIVKNYKTTACEIHKPFADKLSEKMAGVYNVDFLAWDTLPHFSKIVANPPFTRQQDIDHVCHMIDLCCGRVVSVMSASILFRQNRKTLEFRDDIDSLGGIFIELPEGSFKDSGTMVNACIVCIDC